jgi:hypothetical protein
MKTKKTFSAFLLSIVLLSIEPPPRVTASTLGVSQPTICVRLPTQPKTKCRKRVIASKQAPQEYADKIDALWQDFLTNAPIVKEYQRMFPNGIPFGFEKYNKANSKVQSTIKDLKFLANQFPQYFKPDYLLIIKSD